MTSPRKPPVDLPETAGTRDPLTREALAWLVHLHSGDETAQDWEDFQDWKAIDAAHEFAAQQAETLWEQLGPALVRERKSKGPGIPILLAAAIGVAGILFASGAFGPPAAYFAEYQTSTGEIRRVTLRDGSQVDLDSGTSFDVDAAGRTITLYGGQIFVAVKADPKRPFSVVAGDGTTTALGTAFAVRRENSATSVIVTEHAVRVAYANTSRSVKADEVVNAGQAVTYSQQAGLGRPLATDVATLTAWRHGELIFDGRALGDVVAEIGRYRRGGIFIFDEAVRRLPVTGSAEISDVNAFLESIQLALPVTVIRVPGLTVIRRDSARMLTPP